MKEKNVKINKCFTLYGIYTTVDEKYLTVKNVKGHKKIKWADFYKIIKSYLETVLENVIDAKIVEFGKKDHIGVYKVECTKFTPSKIIKTKNEKGEIVEKKEYVDVNTYGGYFHFFFLNLAKRKRFFNIKVQPIWKKRLMERVNEGQSYYEKPEEWEE